MWNFHYHFMFTLSIHLFFAFQHLLFLIMAIKGSFAKTIANEVGIVFHHVGIVLLMRWASYFTMLASCQFFSVRPSEISPCTALKNWVLHNMSFTQTKWNEKYNNNQAFKRTMENQPNNQTLLKKHYGKSTQLIKNCTAQLHLFAFTKLARLLGRRTLQWRSSLQDKVLCSKVAAKRVEEKQVSVVRSLWDKSPNLLIEQLERFFRIDSSQLISQINT